MSRNAGHIHDSADDHARHHEHDHGHAHDHEDGDERRVAWALALTGGFMLAEVAGGLMSGSLALLADAGHMLADTASLALALAAFRVARRPHDRLRSYGYHRFRVLAAFVNAVVLLAVVVWIGVEAVQRLLAPAPVLGGLMLAVAAVGLLVNVASFAVLHGGDRENLNLRGAALHVLGDLFGSAAAIVAAIVILVSGWMPIDPILSVLVALLVVRSAWFILRRSAHILLEGTPDWLDIDDMKAVLVTAVPAVLDVHHVHAWMLTADRPLLTLHAVVAPGTDHPAALAAIQAILRERYEVGHATVQIEAAAACPDASPARARLRRARTRRPAIEHVRTRAVSRGR